MANEPIYRSIQPGTSNNISAVAPDTTNPEPPKKNSGSSSSSTAEKEGEMMSRVCKGKKATLSPPIGQFFINMILQLAAFAAAIAFGVFAVKSIDIARTANEYAETANSYAAQALEEARVANQVALLAVCSQSGNVQNSSFAAFCYRVLNDAPIVMPDVASNLFTRISTATTSPATISSSISITQKRPTNATETTATLFYSALAPSTLVPSTLVPSILVSSTLVPSSQSTQDIPEPTQPRAGVNPNTILAIALSHSLFFSIAIIAIMIIVRFKKRSKGAPSSVSGAKGNGEEQVHGDDQGYVEDQGEDQGDGNAQRYVEEQDGVQGQGKDQADLVFEYEGRLMGIRIFTNKPTI